MRSQPCDACGIACNFVNLGECNRAAYVNTLVLIAAYIVGGTVWAGVAIKVGGDKEGARGGVDTCRATIQVVVGQRGDKHRVVCSVVGSFILIREVDVSRAAVIALNG